MAVEGRLVSPEAGREMSEMYAWYRRHIVGSGNVGHEEGRSRGRHIRIARTTIGETPDGTFNTYPSRPANTFVVEFGETSFDATAGPGLRDLTFTPYDPAEKRVARDLHCNYHEEETLVYVVLVHDQWHIVCPVPELLAFGELAQDVCETDATGIDVTAVKRYPNCEDMPLLVEVENPRGHMGESGGTFVAVKKQCRDIDGNCGTAEAWEILAIVKRPVCSLVFLEDRESCLVKAGLKMSEEYCPANEPTAACPVVDYNDCDTELPACDTTLTFDPLGGCCPVE